MTKIIEVLFSQSSGFSILALALILTYAALDGVRDAFQMKARTDFARNWGHLMGESMRYDFWGIFSLGSWHIVQFWTQAVLILAAAILAQDWSVIIPGAAGFWLVHDGVLNRMGYDRGFFYVGTTAAFDRFFQRFKKPELAQAIAKITALILGLIPFTIKLLNHV